MESISLAVRSDKIKQEIVDFLKKYSRDDVEFLSLEDAEDLQLLQKTRHEETVSISDYLNNAD